MADVDDSAGIGIRRHFSTEGTHPYDQVAWERRDARITSFVDGSVAFEQLGVEVPASWSVNATNILAQKYFRGNLGTPEREASLRQVVDRVVDTIAAWGEADRYFADPAEARAFSDELKWLIVNQHAAFNSPVWFNIGVPGAPAQASACFILAVEDNMASILRWYAEEGLIFKGGSGAGVNLSPIRSSREGMTGGGKPSGPVSFMRGADASAGTIRSGGKTRRAAKMVILDADHPDIEDFIWCKVAEERKARALRDAGFDMGIDGADIHSVQYQNANNSVRVTDDFMQAVAEDAGWELRAVTTGEVLRTVRARELWRQIAQAAWECADPGLQFDTTINRWHTCPASGRINGSNPCFTGDSLVHTDKGLIAFSELLARANVGETFGVYTHDATNLDAPADRVELSAPEAIMITGYNSIVRLRFANGIELRCTPQHRIFTSNRGFVEAGDLDTDDRVKLAQVPTPACEAGMLLPVSNDPSTYQAGGDGSSPLRLPECWSDDFAHYLGWLVGHGRASSSGAVTIYGSPGDRAEVLGRHAELLSWIDGDRPLKPCVQGNGALQLRVNRRAFNRFLEALGVAPVKGPLSSVPWSLFQAPPEVVGWFLQGLFDADGCVRLDQVEGSYVGLGPSSRELLRGVHLLLSMLGISSSIYKLRDASSYGRKDGAPQDCGRSAVWDLRISSGSIPRFAGQVGFSLSRKAHLLEDVMEGRPRGLRTEPATTTLAERSEEGVELTYNLTEPRNHSYIVNGVVVANCSEYMHLDNSACNLASLNLLRFLGEDGSFDAEGFEDAVSVLFTAQEILVGNADYPTEKIGENARRFRQLGIGYTNLGALLMALGLPYDSDEGRALAGTITALMTGQAYATSARTAARLGPFDGFGENRAGMLDVLRMHRAEACRIDESLVPSRLLSKALASWDTAVELAEHHGVRNSQASTLAPTGTISFMMDCDTTGIEPDLSLVKTKRLVGGGTMSIVNQTVPRALRRLGYDNDQIAAIVAYVDAHSSIQGAPELKPEHLAVFACSMGDNTIHHTGHLRMMAAAQPFISGAISKTVNVPEQATVEDIEQVHTDAWRLGLKSVAIYRDNCKVAQPLSTTKVTASAAGQVGATGTRPTRERLPRRRRSSTFKFQVADCEGYVTVGEYDDGRPGEVFMKVSKQGSTLAGIMDACSVAISIGLQHGVPLATFVSKYINMRFEPAGMTDDPEIRLATSLLDYIFRRLAVDYLAPEERVGLGIQTTGERSQQTLPGLEVAGAPSSRVVETLLSESDRVGAGRATAGASLRSGARDAPYCYQCGNAMQRAGSCYVCVTCGTTSGCS